MITEYLPDDSRIYYQKYYTDQAGHGVSVFRGSTIQRGHGIGSMVGNVFRGTLPLLRRFGQTVAKKLVKVGTDVASDALQGRDVKLSLLEHGRAAGGQLLDDLSNNISESDSEIAPKRRRMKKRPTKRKISPSASSLFKNVKVKT